MRHSWHSWRCRAPRLHWGTVRPREAGRARADWLTLGAVRQSTRVAR